MGDRQRALRRRLWIAGSALLLAVLSATLLGYLLTDATDLQHQELAYGAAQDLEDVHLLALAQQERSANARGYLLSGDEAFLEARNAASNRFDELLVKLSERHLGDGTRRELDVIGERWTRLDKASDEAMAMRVRDADAATEYWEHEVRPLQAAIGLDVATLLAAQRAQFDQARDHAQRSAVRARYLLLTLVAGLVLVLALVFHQLARTAAEANELATREQEQTMFALLDQVPVGVFVVDHTGKAYFANQRARHLLGGSARSSLRVEQLAGAYQAFEAGSQAPYPTERTPLVRALRGETSEVTDMELHRGDEVVPLHVRGSPIYAADGELKFAVAAFQDVHELHAAATRDPLTGLGSRRALAQSFVRERMLQERAGSGLVLGILDLDHFKKVNDTHGHAMGDEVLRRTARTLVASLRRTDLVIRWGGEEFVVVLPNADLPSAQGALAKALAAVRAETFVGSDRRSFSVTFSAGLVVTQLNESLESAVARADALLYAAKNAGRNRILTDADAPADA